MTEGNYSNVGHRGPVYKGLGAMNLCDLSLRAVSAGCKVDLLYNHMSHKDVTVNEEPHI
jgi:hypothetical protein